MGLIEKQRAKGQKCDLKGIFLLELVKEGSSSQTSKSVGEEVAAAKVMCVPTAHHSFREVECVLGGSSFFHTLKKNKNKNKKHFRYNVK